MLDESIAVHQLCLYSVLVTATGHFMAFSFVAARRKAAEGKRRIKTEEEELAGMFTYTHRLPLSFIGIESKRVLFSGAKSEYAAKIRRARITIRRMCKQQWWFWLVILLVFLNTCTVAIEHYAQPQWLTEFLCKPFSSNILY